MFYGLTDTCIACKMLLVFFNVFFALNVFDETSGVLEHERQQVNSQVLRALQEGKTWEEQIGRTGCATDAWFLRTSGDCFIPLALPWIGKVIWLWVKKMPALENHRLAWSILSELTNRVFRYLFLTQSHLFILLALLR